MSLPVTDTTGATATWVYTACVWAVLCSLLVQSLPLLQRRRQLTATSGPFFLPGLLAMSVAFVFADNERINLPCTVLAVACILLNIWIPIVSGRKP